MNNKNHQTWSCKIGVIGDLDLKYGSDWPMRQAIQKAFYELTGRECDFCFSGWNSELTRIEEKIVFNGTCL